MIGIVDFWCCLVGWLVAWLFDCLLFAFFAFLVGVVIIVFVIVVVIVLIHLVFG